MFPGPLVGEPRDFLELGCERDHVAAFVRLQQRR